MSNLLKTLGPGILFASTAIGVSHLVQSTRAGVTYGLSLIAIVLLTNILKYPFFEFGSRYANVKKESIIDGYLKLGKIVLWMYFLVTLLSMFFVTAAVGAVTAGFLNNLFNVHEWIPKNSMFWVITTIFILCPLVLIIGRFKILDSLIKVVAVVLLISTLLAFFFALANGPETELSLLPDILWTQKDWLFLIALMGWMPTAVDLSAWNSLWTLERIEQTGYHPTLKETLFDFKFGYIVSALLSVCFITLGAFLAYGTGKTMSKKSHVFANEVVGFYTDTIGEWSFLIIGAASFSIMLGTCIAVFDGYARALAKTIELLKPKYTKSNKKIYNYSLVLISIGAFFVLYFVLLQRNDEGVGFKMLVDLAMTISFIIAPAVAIANLALVSNSNFPKEKRPSKFMQVWSWVGIVFLLAFCVVYFWFW